MERAGSWLSHTGEVLCVDTAPDGSRVASGGEDGVRLWASDGTAAGHVDAPFGEDDVTSVAFLRRTAGTFVASAGSKVYLFDSRNLKAPVHTWAANSDEVNQVVVSSDDAHVAAADDHGEIRVLDISKRALAKTLRKQHKNICSCVAFAPTGELYSGGLDNAICRWQWNQATPRCIQRVETHDPEGAQGFNPPMVHALAVSADGIVAAALGDATVSILTEQAGRLVSSRIRDAHSYSVAHVVFARSDHAATLISGGNDKRLCIHVRGESAITWTTRHTAAHGAKINWLSSLAADTLLVADPSSAISVYKIAS
eukprot:m.252377 g.252377  ORF g.252377 m.252377 type:complete len:312 (+) comp17741_c0_seq1:1-936(+)